MAINPATGMEGPSYVAPAQPVAPSTVEAPEYTQAAEPYSGLTNPDPEGYQPPEYDSEGMLGAQVNDINTLTSQDNPLMQQAQTQGMQYANQRGLLNSSMAAGAAEDARLKQVMPMVMQNAQTRGQADITERGNLYSDYSQESEQGWTADENALNRYHDVQMMAEEYGFKSDLINLEQEWNQIIQGDINAAAFWQSSIDGLMDIMNNEDMTSDQQKIALREMMGYTDPTSGTFHPGTISSGLDFLQRLSAYSSGSIDSGLHDVTYNPDVPVDIGDTTIPPTDGVTTPPVEVAPPTVDDGLINGVVPSNPNINTGQDPDIIQAYPGGQTDYEDQAAADLAYKNDLQSIQYNEYYSEGDTPSQMFEKIAADFEEPLASGTHIDLASREEAQKMALAISMYDHNWIPSDGNPDDWNNGHIVAYRDDVYIEKYFSPDEGDTWASSSSYSDTNPIFGINATKEIPAQILFYYNNMPDFTWQIAGTGGVEFVDGAEASFLPGGAQDRGIYSYHVDQDAFTDETKQALRDLGYPESLVEGLDGEITNGYVMDYLVGGGDPTAQGPENDNLSYGGVESELPFIYM